MNLIKDAWIPIRRRNGTIDCIAPCQITEETIVELAANRPDFNGALIQFLIGLLQTTCAPENPRQWRQWLQQPPEAKELQAKFEPIADAFNLNGDGPRFMQDLTLKTEDESPVYELLIDMPTEDTKTDHFIKRGEIKQLCLTCAATALFTLQTNSPFGGRGYRTGLRGGGPMTTLVLADTLWKTCWLNILEQQTFLSLANSNKDKDSDRFPWLASTRTSEGGTMTTPEDVHPDQIFWSMPRRIRLLIEEKEAVCDLCGMADEYIVCRFITKNLGVNYKGTWKHPLSPYFIDKDGTSSAIHPQPGGIGYRHWLGLVQLSQDDRGKRQPAHVIEHFIRERRNDLRLWAFGYDMDGMKARCWYEGTMPLISASDTVCKDYEYHISAMVSSAQQVCRETRSQIKKALFKRPGDVKGDFSFINSRFWQETKPDFFTCLYKLRDGLENNSDVVPILEKWYKRLKKVAETIFDDTSQTGAFDAADPKRIAIAWRDLQKGIYKVREQLGLPAKEQTKK